MIEKVRDIIRAADRSGRHGSRRRYPEPAPGSAEDAIRQLKDRQELFVAGENVIQFGRHRFAVNIQPLDLTTIVRDDTMLNSI
jgi:hypothetical protein